MAFVELMEDEEFAAPDRELLGYTPNFCRLFARRPAAYAAWKQLNGAIKETMDLRRYELATVAAAGELRSSYCSLAHGKGLFERVGFTPGDPVDEHEQAVPGLARSGAARAAGVHP